METKSSIESIREQLLALEIKMATEVGLRLNMLQGLHPAQFESGKNLIEYLTLRKEDYRNLQDELHIHGLSSLASSESHIHRQAQAILERLGKIYTEEELDTCTYAFSKKKIRDKSQQLFGKQLLEDIPSLMVTFDSGFADNYALIKSLLLSGMNVARINCAHDDEATWSKMIQKIKKARKQTGLDCKIYMDLAGPKIRTKILGKGKEEGEIKIKDKSLIWLAEDLIGFEGEEVVISPNESGIISMLKKGDRVYIDDGKFGGIVEKVKKGKVGVRINRVSSKKGLIKNEKGINFPDTILKIPSLTTYDKSCLPFICEHADLLGYSFVKTTEDIRMLREAIKELGGKNPSLIIKIETHEAVDNLPYLLLEGMKHRGFGVMIARGDLAVEIGFERTGEIQEEILWICEAAHVPVVWATQVLESLNKSGMATRSEITDAGQSANAECVMINKGEHTLEVIATLKNILKRTASHRIKKRFRFRSLKIAEKFMAG
ncbi:pyruvate kinase [Aquiflexum lacus]|uniref:pyruvate kinase n=1 Tax=Aquiflexum lacus TaxID=2483805 RepID=UPI0018947979|nr:pyruvate kinase [Aquiflexum lacus]